MKSFRNEFIFECPKCGTEVVEGAEGCPSCGTKLEWDRDDREPSQASEWAKEIYQPGGRLARTVVRLLYFCIFLTGVTVAGTIISIEALLRADRDFVQHTGALAVYTDEFMTYGIICFIGFAVASGAFLTWVYRAYGNLDALGVRDLHYTRGSALWKFLVPPTNLFLPLDVVGELLQKSALPSDDVNSPGRQYNGIVTIWWITFITSVAVVAAGSAMIFGKYSATLSVNGGWTFIAGCFLLFLSASSLTFLIKAIEKKQEDRNNSIMEQTEAPARG